MKSTFALVALSIFLISHEVDATMKKPVSFESEGQTLAATLYLPDAADPARSLPAVVITGAWTSVKEQMPSTYAVALAERGYAALVFDFRGWGASAGGIPFLEDPGRKTADILAAIDFLATQPEVDADKIAGLGICASAGYMSDATLASDRVRSLALVAPWLHDSTIVEATYGGADSVAQLIELGRSAGASAKPTLIEAASTTNEQALMYQAPYYTETDRGLIPEYDNQFNVASWAGWLTYDALQTAKRMTKPTVLVHSEAAAIPAGARQYAETMGDKASMIWLDDVTQFDFYDRPDVVTRAADAVAAHFGATL